MKGTRVLSGLCEGGQSQDATKLASKRGHRECFHMQASVGCSINIYVNRNAFLLRITAPRSEGMLVLSLPMESIKMVTCDVFDIFSTHASLLHDVRDYWAQNDSTHVTFTRQLSSNRVKIRMKDCCM